jgi:hypothetical protein
MYSEVGRKTTGTKLAIVSGASTSAARSWRIRISQIECSSEFKPPAGCTQYYTERSGTFESFNFNDGILITPLAAYNICFKTNMGTCGMEYTVDGGTTTPAAFCLTTSQATAQTTCTAQAANNARAGSACNQGKIDIAGVENSVSTTFCGVKLNAIDQAINNGNIRSKGAPYRVSVTVTGTDTIASTGFKINYIQRTDCS